MSEKRATLKQNPAYKVVTRGQEVVYFCQICVWTFPRGHEHFDHSKQVRLEEFV